MTHVTHPQLLIHLTNDLLTHCQLCYYSSVDTTRVYGRVHGP